MKTVRIIESCIVNRAHAEAGSILRGLQPGIAADLIANGRAVIVADQVEEVVTRDPEPVHRDPQPPKASRKK